ncbi:unnamed protein product [Prunus armeniaca]
MLSQPFSMGSESKVYKLHKALYGLKQAPRAWYSEIDSYFAECGFTKNQSEATLYIKTRGEASILIMSIYVDDIVYTGNNQAMLEEFKQDMMEKYEMTDLGLLHHFLGMRVIQTSSACWCLNYSHPQEVVQDSSEVPRNSGRVLSKVKSHPDLEACLNKSWPNFNSSKTNMAFWKYEYNKHGKCSDVKVSTPA